MMSIDELPTITEAGFSTGVEPCATMISTSSGDSTFGALFPVTFGLATATCVRRNPSISGGWAVAVAAYASIGNDATTNVRGIRMGTPPIRFGPPFITATLPHWQTTLA